MFRFSMLLSIDATLEWSVKLTLRGYQLAYYLPPKHNNMIRRG